MSSDNTAEPVYGDDNAGYPRILLGIDPFDNQPEAVMSRLCSCVPIKLISRRTPADG